MRKIFLGVLVYFISFDCIGQKRPLDFNTFEKWPELQDTRITNDGKYSMYTVLDKKTGVRMLTVVSNTGQWHFASEKIRGEAKFSSDSRSVFFINKQDSLVRLVLGSGSLSFWPDIGSYEVGQNSVNYWLAYLRRKGEKLTVRNLKDNHELIYPNVTFYQFSRDDRSMILERNDTSTHEQILQWIELSTGKTKLMWEGNQVEQYALDESCERFSFIGTGSQTDDQSPDLYYFKEGMKEAVCEISGKRLGEEGKMMSRESPQFNRDGTKILFAVKELKKSKPVGKVKDVDFVIWNYRDSVLQSIQRSPGYEEQSPKIWEVLNIDNSKAIQVGETNEYEYVETRPGFENYLLVTKSAYDGVFDNSFSLFLVSASDGRRTRIFDKDTHTYSISPDERFVVWFDPVKLRYYDYEIPTGITTDLGESIPVPLHDEEQVDMGRSAGAAYGLCGWSKKEHSVYLYDKYDIWKIDMLGKDKPVNITYGYGRAHSLVFSTYDLTSDIAISDFDLIGNNILSVFDINTKGNSLIELGNTLKRGMSEVQVDPYSYYIGRTGFLGYDKRADGRSPVKARDSGKYLVRRMNASEFPNLFLTDDFKHFKQLSFLDPQKSYNWMTSKLVSWKNSDGKSLQGILYLPEDFDSAKKYPVLFECYEKMSNDLNHYLTPGTSNARINIPYFVSNGYLVFEPDLTWKMPAKGAGVVDALVSAAKYLSMLPWVDSTKLGLQGHSFGGWVAGYASTHTHVFAAICSASGVYDMVSEYGELHLDGTSCQGSVENSQIGPFGTGVTPWTDPSMYMNNSALFNVSNASTPLLIVHGGKDQSTCISAQAIELYLALRRAKKKVWFLEYEKGDHTQYGDDAIDMTVRMKQFFDHYLKRASPPMWMTVGVPYSERGFNSGLGLDSSGTQP